MDKSIIDELLFTSSTKIKGHSYGWNPSKTLHMNTHWCMYHFAEMYSICHLHKILPQTIDLLERLAQNSPIVASGFK